MTLRIKISGQFFILVGLIVALWYFKPFVRKEVVKPEYIPPIVTVAKPAISDVQEYYYFTGTTTAYEFAQIRARVKGFLKSIEFTDSTEIKQGDLLFVIEPEPFEAQRDYAKAQLESSEAALRSAQSDLERVQEAIKTDAVSKQDVDTKLAARDKAAAAVKAAQAQLSDAQIMLSYTRLTSPIDGTVSRNYVDVGNLVGSGENTLLTTVAKMDPIYVYFSVSEDLLVGTLREISLNERVTPTRDFDVALPDDDNYFKSGQIDYRDNQIDPTTGTIMLRGKLDNKDRLLFPGMYINVRVPKAIKQNAVLVEEAALGTDMTGKYLYVVNNDNIVEHRIVKIGSLTGNMRIIEQGLDTDELYITQGLQRARPGLAVTPQLAAEHSQGNN